MEEEVLSYWKEVDAFGTQLKKSEGRKPYSFFDGPPFATGMPHYGHICAGTIKDVITRYATMTGHHVPRRFGWDCHGLPVEFEIDKALKIETKNQREEFGLANYNNECRSIVMRYSEAWETIVTRLGRWIDFKDDYKTLDTSFMESVWWVFKQIYDKGHVYRGCKIMPYSNGCNTVLSNFEAGLNFKEVIDPAIFITFPLMDDPEVSLIGWTTTPWTLPSNLGCVVHPDFTYVKFKDLASGKLYIVAESRLNDLYGIAADGAKKTANKKKKAKNNKKKGKVDEGVEIVNEEQKEEAADKTIADFVEILETCKGTDLENKQYIPLFNYMEERRKDGCFKVLCDTYVTDDAGTGVVHTAPAYGEDDYRVSMKYGIIKPDDPGVLVDENGFFTNIVSDYKGVHLKVADKQIIKDLKDKGRLFKQSQIKHSYPFCWRSDTPLIYKAVDQWFINVSQFKDKIIANNNTARWVPEPIQTGRFHNWLADANDWCFSRDRFWGNPIPIWVSDDGEEIVVIGSVQELKELSGVQEITDIHRESIDHITIPSKQGKGVLKRIPEVFDCWFESGSMPYASVGYPTKITEEDFKKIFPADFIGEGLDQTRGWFYTLNVIATALFDVSPYKNLIVNGMVLAEDGAKMSKSKKNFDDPMDVVHEYGADAIRLYLMNSPLVRADPLRFTKTGVYDVARTVFRPWYNVCRFMLQNINRWENEFGEKFVVDEQLTSNLNNLDNVMDKWILASSQNLIKFVREELDNYRLYSVLEKKVKFLENLSNWYVKLNRDRLRGTTGKEDWTKCLNTLYTVMLNSMILMAPYVPFIVEGFYQDMRLLLKKDSAVLEDSIHYLLIPEFNQDLVDDRLLEAVDKMQRMVERARAIRDTKNVTLKQCVNGITVVCLEEQTLEKLKLVEEYIKSEVNVVNVEFTTEYKKYMQYNLTPNHKLLGERLKAEYGKRIYKINKSETNSYEAWTRASSRIP